MNANEFRSLEDRVVKARSAKQRVDLLTNARNSLASVPPVELRVGDHLNMTIFQQSIDFSADGAEPHESHSVTPSPAVTNSLMAFEAALTNLLIALRDQASGEFDRA